MSDATYHAHWQQSQELHDRGAYTAGGRPHGADRATDAPTPPPNARETAIEGEVPPVDPAAWITRGIDTLCDALVRVGQVTALGLLYQLRREVLALGGAHRRAAADLNHLLAALSIEKSKTIPEIRDLYGLTKGERP